VYSGESRDKWEEENNEAERTNSIYSTMDGASDDEAVAYEDDDATDATATATDDDRSDSEADSDDESDHSNATKKKGASGAHVDVRAGVGV
jgi:hypothetical protein